MQKKFSTSQVAILRTDLLTSGLDRFQVAETIKSFVVSLGYGISLQTASEVAGRLDDGNNTLEVLHRELEASALVM